MFDVVYNRAEESVKRGEREGGMGRKRKDKSDLSLLVHRDGICTHFVPTIVVGTTISTTLVLPS